MNKISRFNALSVVAAVLTSAVIIFLVARELYAVRHVLTWENLRVDQKSLELTAQVKNLNHSIPKSFDKLFDVNFTGRAYSAVEMEPYLIYFEKITRYLNGMFDAYAFMGLCHYAGGDYGRAADAWVKSLEGNARFFWPSYNLAVLFYQTGNYDEALVFIQKARSSKPQDTVTIFSASKIYQQLIAQAPGMAAEWPRRLKAAYEELYLLETAVYFRLGVAEMDQGNLDRAQFFFREVISRDAQHPEAYFYFGKILERKQLKTEAVQMLQTARSISSLRKDNPYRFHPKVF